MRLLGSSVPQDAIQSLDINFPVDRKAIRHIPSATSRFSLHERSSPKIRSSLTSSLSNPSLLSLHLREGFNISFDPSFDPSASTRPPPPIGFNDPIQTLPPSPTPSKKSSLHPGLELDDEKSPSREDIPLQSNNTAQSTTASDDDKPSSSLKKEGSKEKLPPMLSPRMLAEVDENSVPWGVGGGSLSEWKEHLLKSCAETSHSRSSVTAVGEGEGSLPEGKEQIPNRAKTRPGSVEDIQDQTDIGSRNPNGEATATQSGTPLAQQEISENPTNAFGPEVASLMARHEREIQAVKEELEAFENIIANLEGGEMPIYEGEIEVIKRTRIHLREEAERMIKRLEEELAIHQSGKMQVPIETENVQVEPENAKIVPENVEETPAPMLIWFRPHNKQSIADTFRGLPVNESHDPGKRPVPVVYSERPSKSRFKAISALRTILTRGWKSVARKLNKKRVSAKLVETEPQLTAIAPTIIPQPGTYPNPWAQIVANQSSSVKASVLASGTTGDVPSTSQKLDTTTATLGSDDETGPDSSALILNEEGMNVDLEILNDMRRLVEGVLEDEQQLKGLLEVEGEDAQLLLDALQVLAKLSDVATNLRSLMLKMMLQLSKRSGLCPQCLMIENVERLGERPVAQGGFGDVWKGKIGDQIVCLKTIKVYEFSDISALLKEYMREAIVWQQLKHPNLLPFLGMCYLDKVQTQLCLVSPWMERGTLVGFLKNTPRADVDHYALVYDVASGLSYLHDEDIVHGDLKGLNVLITPDERACITDFGLSRVQGTHKHGLTSTKIDKGTTRYSSPELLTGSNSSLSSDIYAFGCVCYEIFEGKAPFHELKLDASVIVTVLVYKKHPSRPELTSLNDTMWEIMVDCWAVEPWKRPEASEILARVSNLKPCLTRRQSRGNIEPAPSWDVYPLSQIERNGKRPRIDMAALTQLQKTLSMRVRSTVLCSQDSLRVTEEGLCI